MRRFAGRFVIALAGCLALLSAYADDDARCGSGIVSVGMSKSDVLAACGQPASQKDVPQAKRDGNMVVGTTMQSIWTYVSGAVQTVFTFDEDTLTDIEVN